MSVAAKRITPSDGEDVVNAAAVPERHPALERVGAPIAGGPGSSPDGSTEGWDDGVLLEGVAGGDAAAFAALMQRHLSAVLATARRIVRDESRGRGHCPGGVPAALEHGANVGAEQLRHAAMAEPGGIEPRD